MTVVVSLKTFVEFRSDKFPPVAGEEEQINPGRWGKRLADFLRDGLHAGGFETSEPIAEDWGWIVPVVNSEFNLWIGCGNYEEYPDGFLCFIEPNKPFIRKFLKKIDTSARIEALQKVMDKVFDKEPSIRDKRWWTAEEFNSPKSRTSTGPE